MRRAAVTVSLFAFAIAGCASDDGDISLQASADEQSEQTSTSDDAGADTTIASDAPDETTAPEPVGTTSEASTVVSDAAATTLATGTATFSTEFAGEASDGTTRTLSYAGVVDFATGDMRWTATTATGVGYPDSDEIVAVGEDFYLLQSAGTQYEGIWLRQSAEELGVVSMTIRPADVPWALHLLDRVGEWSAGTPDLVDGTPATRYDGTLVQAPLVVTTAAGVDVPTFVGPGSDVSVWITDDGVVARTSVGVALGTNATATTTYADFGVAADLAAPAEWTHFGDDGSFNSVGVAQ